MQCRNPKGFQIKRIFWLRFDFLLLLTFFSSLYREYSLIFFYRTLLKPVPKDKSTNIWMCSDYIYVSGSNCVVARY